MLDTFFALFLFAAGIVGFLASIILLLFKTDNKMVKFLGLHLLIICLHIFYVAAWNEGIILVIPHILNTTYPMLLFCIPSFYLYVNGMLYNQKFTSKKVYWHLIPAFIAFIADAPVYILSTKEKISLIEAKYKLFEHPEQMEQLEYSWDEIYTYMLVISTLVYTVLVLYTFIKFLRKDAEGKENLARFTKWLKTLFGIGFTNLFIIIMAVVFSDSELIAAGITQFIIGAHILTISLTLFFNPNILYGINEPMQVSGTLVHFPVSRKLIISERQKEDYLNSLQSYLSTHPFLRQNFSQKIMAEETKIPVHRLSYLINEHYGFNYNEFINKLRIEYLLQEMNNKRWENYSIEGIAKEVGFKSKSTFISAFKKTAGTTPSNYFKDYGIPGN
ncbi:MAG: helix-turn-helix domain-containing protein [bacterium]